MNKNKQYILNGFTLIELMITIGLLAIVLSLSFGTLSFLNTMLVRSEIDRLYTTCMYAQRCAQVANEQQTIGFDIDNNSYTYDRFTHHLPPHVCFGIIPLLSNQSNPKK